MSRFDAGDREQGMDMLEAAEEVFVGLGAPSRLAVSVFSAVMASMGVDDESPAYGIAAGASQMGYACRMADDSNELSGALVAAFISQLALDGDGAVVYEELAEDPEKFTTLVEYVATIADDPAAVAALAGADVDVWDAFSTTATFQLHRNFMRNGLPKRALPEHDSVENLPAPRLRAAPARRGVRRAADRQGRRAHRAGRPLRQRPSAGRGQRDEQRHGDCRAAEPQA